MISSSSRLSSSFLLTLKVSNDLLLFLLSLSLSFFLQDHFRDLMRDLYDVMTRSREGWAPPPHKPDVTDIFFVKGSPLSKHDLQRCYVDKAYAVVLLGDREGEYLAGR